MLETQESGKGGGPQWLFSVKPRYVDREAGTSVPPPLFYRRHYMFKWLILFSGLFIASMAAWFSVSGISQLFQGAQIAALLMASSLELGKLVSISYVIRNWNRYKILRNYMIGGALVLCLVTSVGIYGFLASAYAKNSSELNLLKNRTDQVENSGILLDTRIKFAQDRLLSLQNIQVQQENRLDILTPGTTFRSQQTSLRQTTANINEVQKQLTEFSKQKDSLEGVKLQLQQTIYESGKIASLSYFADSLGISLDKMVQWFIIILILVFDPMSIALIIAFNRLDTKHESKDNTKEPGDSSLQQNPAILSTPFFVNPPPVPAPQPMGQTNEIPYYIDPNYDWNNDDRWKTDPNAQIYRERKFC